MNQKDASRISREVTQFYGVRSKYTERDAHEVGGAVFNHAHFILPEGDAALVTAYKEDQPAVLVVADGHLYVVYPTPPEGEWGKAETRHEVYPLTASDATWKPRAFASGNNTHA